MKIHTVTSGNLSVDTFAHKLDLVFLHIQNVVMLTN